MLLNEPAIIAKPAGLKKELQPNARLCETLVTLSRLCHTVFIRSSE